jgi:hypothetical protein
VNRRRIAIGVSSISGLAVVAAGAMSMFASSGGSTSAVNPHAAPVAAVTGSAGLTRQAGTAQLDTVVTVASPAVAAHGSTPAAPAQTLTMHGSGLVDFGKQVGAVDLTVPNGGLQEVLTPGTLYVRRAPAAQNAASPVKGWTRMDTAKVSDGNLISGGATDPSLVFAMLGGTQQDVKYMGQDMVRGVPVAHYQGTLDLAQAAAALTGDVKGIASGAASGAASAKTTGATTAAAVIQTPAAADEKALGNAARAFATTKVPFDAYLDAQGRLRRFVANFSYLLASPGKPVVHVTSATELYSFGTPVTVVAPTGAPTASGKTGAAGAAGATGAAGTTPTASQSPSSRRATTPTAHSSSPTSSHK